MSKNSKSFSLVKHFGIVSKPKPKTQSLAPDSAKKGKYFQFAEIQCQEKTNQQKRKNQFYLSYRQKYRKQQLIEFFKIKQLYFPTEKLQIQDLSEFKILGTVDKKIIMGFNNKLNIFCYFDQHAIHERIRYQYYLDVLKNYGLEKPKLKNWDQSVIQKEGKYVKLISNIKHCYTSYKVSQQLDRQLGQNISVQQYGFQVEYVKSSKILKIIKIPYILERALDPQLILNISHELILGKNQLPKPFQSIIAEISCKSAYKFNDFLSHQTIIKLLKNLSLCQYPFFCVHGRPTIFVKG